MLTEFYDNVCAADFVSTVDSDAVSIKLNVHYRYYSFLFTLLVIRSGQAFIGRLSH